MSKEKMEKDEVELIKEMAKEDAIKELKEKAKKQASQEVYDKELEKNRQELGLAPNMVRIKLNREITINGKKFVGTVTVTKEEAESLIDIDNRASRELSGQQRQRKITATAEISSSGQITGSTPIHRGMDGGR